MGLAVMRAVPKSWASWDFRVSEHEVEVAYIDVAWFREAADVTVEGVPYRMARAGFASGAFELRHGGETIARAEKPSAFRRTFDVRFDGRRYGLAPRSILGRTFELRRDGVTVGTIRRETWTSRKARVELPDELPLPVRVFVLWLVLLMWKRESDAAASSGGGH